MKNIKNNTPLSVLKDYYDFFGFQKEDLIFTINDLKSEFNELSLVGKLIIPIFKILTITIGTIIANIAIFIIFIAFLITVSIEWTFSKLKINMGDVINNIIKGIKNLYNKIMFK